MDPPLQFLVQRSLWGLIRVVGGLRRSGARTGQRTPDTVRPWHTAAHPLQWSPCGDGAGGGGGGVTDAGYHHPGYLRLNRSFANRSSSISRSRSRERSR
jgi:hypothetical protein